MNHRFPLSVLCVWQCPEASEEVTSVSWDQHIQSTRSTWRRKEEKKKKTTQSPSSLSLSIGMDSSRPVLWLSGLLCSLTTLNLCIKTWLCSGAQNEWMQNKQHTLEGAHYRQKVLHQDHPNLWEGWMASALGGSNLDPAFPPFASWLFAPFLSFLHDFPKEQKSKLKTHLC